MSKYDEILNFLDEIQEALSQLLTSGFNAYHEYTAHILKELGERAESYGLIYAGEKLNILCEKLNEKRHNFEFDFSEFTKEYSSINEYCAVCRKRLDIMRAEEFLEAEDKIPD